MEIVQLRHCTGMSQRAFSKYFGIPLGTLRNWEQGIAKPPEYVFHMIFATTRRDKMVNIETVKFLKMLDDLAKLSSCGIDDFENATEETIREKVFYDKAAETANGEYRIVLDAVIIDDPECLHHDVVSYYDSNASEYTIGVAFDEDEMPYILLKMNISNEQIVIENGVWYFA